MHNKYFIIYNEQTNLDFGVSVVTRPSKPSPIMEYEEKDVSGRDGKLYIEKGYRDIEISVSFNFISKNNNNWDKDFRAIKRWLLSKSDNKLKFSDDLEVFYKVNKIAIDTPERVLKRIGRFNVTFTCQPYTYFEDGLNEINLPSKIYNDNCISKPIYKVAGEGVLNLTVNGNKIKANVGQNLTIDTELGLCYRTDGTINNIALTGYYEDMYLIEGDNIFSYTGNFDIKIIPNWRYI